MSQLSTPIAVAVLLAMPPGENDGALLWMPVAGLPLLAWPLAGLRSAPEIGPIALVVPNSRLDEAARLIAAEGFADTHVLAMPPGTSLADLSPGAARHPLSPRERGTGGEVVAPRVIVLHDAARPFIPTGHIAALVAKAVEAGFAVSAEPVKETIKRVAQGRVVETLPRDELAQLIPPLAVRADVLPTLLETPSFTRIMDCVAAALALGMPVRTVPLAGSSVAVSTPEDLTVAEALLRASSIPIV